MDTTKSCKKDSDEYATDYIKIIKDIDLKELEKFGIKEDEQYINNDYAYAYEFLRIDKLTREITISSGYDEINGNKELLKFYELVKAGLVETVREGTMEDVIQSKINTYIDCCILDLDVSESTKNTLKRQLRKIFLDEDFIINLKLRA